MVMLRLVVKENEKLDSKPRSAPEAANCPFPVSSDTVVTWALAPVGFGGTGRPEIGLPFSSAAASEPLTPAGSGTPGLGIDPKGAAGVTGAGKAGQAAGEQRTVRGILTPLNTVLL